MVLDRSHNACLTPVDVGRQVRNLDVALRKRRTGRERKRGIGVNMRVNVYQPRKRIKRERKEWKGTTGCHWVEANVSCSGTILGRYETHAKA